MIKKVVLPSARFSVARAHPWLTWSAVAAIATIISMIAAGGLWTVANVESAADATKREEETKAFAKSEVDKLRSEIKIHMDAAARTNAWSLVMTKRLEVLTLRNRVNDCHAAKLQSTIEMSACKQYEDEFADSTAQYQEMQKNATQMSKDQP